jgi:hypothetical protein
MSASTSPGGNCCDHDRSASKRLWGPVHLHRARLRIDLARVGGGVCIPRSRLRSPAIIPKPVTGQTALRRYLLAGPRTYTSDRKAV